MCALQHYQSISIQLSPKMAGHAPVWKKFVRDPENKERALCQVMKGDRVCGASVYACVCVPISPLSGGETLGKVRDSPGQASYQILPRAESGLQYPEVQTRVESRPERLVTL